MKTTYHSIHKAGKAPEGIDFVGQEDQNRGQEITHALYVAKVKVIHDVRHEDIMQKSQVWVVLSLKEWMCSIRPVHVFLFKYKMHNE